MGRPGNLLIVTPAQSSATLVAFLMELLEMNDGFSSHDEWRRWFAMRWTTSGREMERPIVTSVPNHRPTSYCVAAFTA